MKEASYLSSISSDIEKQIGGKVIKISDRSTLGLPDSMHIRDGIVTYIETKIDEHFEIYGGIIHVQPWKAVKKDLRQFEICRSISRHSLVVYMIYYPAIKRTAVLSVDLLVQFRPSSDDEDLKYLSLPKHLVKGKGVQRLSEIMGSNRKEILHVLSTADVN